ncbi:acyltransferase family protein [Psychromicrobium xiongbiense]|uniref:acyltransferase family protein n=1 Tax=Psychromicrobium xiongbiense TaxID=3051184 RepID=UPI0025553AD8|nr:acyltransferase [Psychromicrobium sp. YIM S02556]
MRTTPTLRRAVPARTNTSPSAIAALPAGRDLVVDLVRVGCMFAVVAVHLLMIGISVKGGITIVNPLTDITWFAQGTWWGQVMPLFFVVGGFASLTSWRSAQRKAAQHAPDVVPTSTVAASYLRARLLRLVRPTVALYAFLAVALWTAYFAGAPTDLLKAIAVGSGVQLWFLAAYLICQLLVPVLAACHERARWLTALTLLAASVIVDLVRFSTGQEAWGLLNMVFLWSLVQQLGFFYADGLFSRMRRWQLAAVALSCYLLLIPLTHGGPYPVDMLSAENPPMMPLVLIGLAQICLVVLCYPALNWLTRQSAVQKVMYVVGSRSMTIYLWHLPLIIAMFGVALLVGLPFPEPGSAGWWLSRPLFYLAAFGVVLLVTRPLTRLELAPTTLRPGTTAPSLWLVVLATLLATAGPFAVLREGLNLDNVLWGLLGLVAALFLVRDLRWPARIVSA